MTDDISYFWSHPPRCLDGPSRKTEGALRELLAVELGGHSTAFTPECTCGNSTFVLRASADCPQARIECSSCGTDRVVFDADRHGYNGELGIYQWDSVEAPIRGCAACAGSAHEIALAFQYSGEADILDEDDSLEIQPEDLFGWVMIAALCRSCGATGLLASYECA